MWIDATVAAGVRYNPKQSQGRRQGRLRAGADRGTWPKGANWLWSWALGDPDRRREGRTLRKKFIDWATSKEYIELVGEKEGWVSVPPGTRKSTYDKPEYQKAAPFASFVLKAIETADPTDPTRQARALYRRAVRRHPGVPGARHPGRPDDRRRR